MHENNDPIRVETSRRPLNEPGRLDGAVDELIDVASTWIGIGAQCAQAALGAAADGLQATADALGRIGDSFDDPDRTRKS